MAASSNFFDSAVPDAGIQTPLYGSNVARLVRVKA
jgi:hypothetical protein